MLKQFISKYARRNIILLCILIMCTMFMTINITQPWIGADANAGVKRGIEAKNYLRYGFINLKFGQANNYEAVSDIKDIHYYQHHPPLTSILIAFSFLIFGVSEISARIVPIFLTVGSIILLFLIAKRCYDEHIALLSAFIFSVMPVTTFLGKLPNYKPVSLFFILLSVLLYMKWLDDKKIGKFTAFLFVYVISLSSDWPAYFLGMLIPLHYLSSEILEKRRFSIRKEILIIPLLSVIGFVLFLYYIYLVNPDDIHDLFLQLKIYLGMVSNPSEALKETHGGEFLDFTMIQFFKKILNYANLVFSYPVLIIALFGLWFLIKDIIYKKNIKNNLIPILFFLLAFLYNSIFYKSVFIHNSWIFYFGVPLALLGALGIDGIIRKNLNNGKYFWELPLSTVYVFIFVLILLPAIFNLKEFHGIQRKVLPGKQFESVTLITNIAYQLKSFTDSDSLILTNLSLRHDGLKGGPMVNYYAERKIKGNIDGLAELSSRFKSVLKRKQSVYFYLWEANPKSDKGYAELENFLMQEYNYIPLSVENYEFKLFKIF